MKEEAKSINDNEEVEEGMKESLLSLAFAASLLSIPNILKAEDIVRNIGSGKPTAEQVQTAIRKAEASEEKFGGYSKAEAANILARTIYKEGRGEGHDGRHHIATVIYNRANKDRGKFVSVCFKHKAFSVWNKSKPSTSSGKYSPGKYKVCVPLTATKNKAEEEAWEDSKKIASSLMEQTFKADGTYNAYYNPDKVTPSWSTSLQNAKSLGNHKFGYLSSEDPTNVSAKKTSGKTKSETSTYVVQTGDNGVSFIAKRLISSGKYNGETVKSLTDRIISANGMKAENPIIRVGQRIVLPQPLEGNK